MNLSIPLLVLVAPLPMKLAVGIWLLFIVAKSLIGFIGDLTEHTVDWTFLLIFTILSIAGIFLGFFASKYLPGERLVCLVDEDIYFDKRAGVISFHTYYIIEHSKRYKL